MNHFKFLILTLVLFFCVIKSKAQVDHLEPVGGIFDVYSFQFDYYSSVRKVLFNGLTDDPEIRFLVMPSFSPENVLDIIKDEEKDKYYIDYHIAEQSIWYSKNKADVKISKFRKQLSKSSVELIKNLYRTAIFNSRFIQKESLGVDGTQYFFSIKDHGLKTGTVWSPGEKSLMRELVEVGYGLIEFANSDKIEINNDLEERIINLTIKLK